MRLLSKIVNGAAAVITAGAILLGLSIMLPGLFGIHPYIVESGSMEPVIHTGALAYINEKDRDPEPGDIIMYCLTDAGENPVYVTHRFTGMNEDGNYITKGDANETEDFAPVEPDKVIGTYLWSVPGAGYLLAEFQGKKMILVVVWIVILNVIGILLERLAEEDMNNGQ